MHVPIEDAWLCILSLPPSPGHLGFLVYIPLGGVRKTFGVLLHLVFLKGCIRKKHGNHNCRKGSAPGELHIGLSEN